MHFFNEYLQSRIQTWRRNSTGWHSGNCPMCVSQGESRPDTKKRGGVLFEGEGWRYHCFNCNYVAGWEPGHSMSGRVKGLLKGLGADESEVQRISLELMREEETAQLLNPLPEPPPSYKPNWPEVEVPGDPLVDVANIDDIVISGIDMIVEREIAYIGDWHYARTPLQFKRRFILPYTYQGKKVGYTARYIGDPPAGTPKYLVKKPEHFVFNLDAQHGDREFVIVTEGDFDALSVDGVSVGTNTIDDEQASLISNLHRRVIVVPDADAAGMKMVESALKYDFDVAFPEWMDSFKDINGAASFYGRGFTVASVREAALSNPTKIRVMAKRYCRDRA